MVRGLAHQIMKQHVHQIRDALEELKLDGLDCKIGTIRYSADDAKVTLTFTRPGENEALIALRRSYPDLVGKEFMHGGRPYELCGLKPRSPRFPFIGKNEDGKLYKFSGEVIDRAFPGTTIYHQAVRPR